MIVSIQPVSTWNNGNTIELNAFRMNIVSDNLKDSCTFYWQIGNQIALQPEGVQNTWVQDGNLTMTGTGYANWNGSNTYAFDWALAQLNLQRAQTGTIASVPTLKLAPVLPQ